MLEVIKYVDFTTNSFSCDNIVTLRHISGFVNFTSMINLGLDCDSLIFNVTTSDTIHIFRIILVIPGVFRWFERDFNLKI